MQTFMEMDFLYENIIIYLKFYLCTIDKVIMFCF